MPKATGPLTLKEGAVVVGAVTPVPVGGDGSLLWSTLASAVLVWRLGSWQLTASGASSPTTTTVTATSTLTVIDKQLVIWAGTTASQTITLSPAADGATVTVKSNENEATENVVISGVDGFGSIPLLVGDILTVRYSTTLAYWVTQSLRSGSQRPFAYYGTGVQTPDQATHELYVTGGTDLRFSTAVFDGTTQRNSPFPLTWNVTNVGPRFAGAPGLGTARVASYTNTTICTLEPYESVLLDSSLRIISKKAALNRKTYTASGLLDLNFSLHVATVAGIVLTFPAALGVSDDPELYAAGHGNHTVINEAVAASAQVQVQAPYGSINLTLNRGESAMYGGATSATGVTLLGTTLPTSVGGTASYAVAGTNTAQPNVALHTVSVASTLDFATAPTLDRTGGYQVQNTSIGQVVVQIAGVTVATTRPGEVVILNGKPLQYVGRYSSTITTNAEAHGSTGSPGTFAGQQAWSTATLKIMTWTGSNWVLPPGSVIRIPFTASNTSSIPLNTRSALITLIGPGGSGGSGRRGAAGTVRGGGSGGNSGQVVQMQYPFSSLGPTIFVGIGAAGAPGSSAVSDNTNGTPASGSGTTTAQIDSVGIGMTILALGGSAGQGGSTVGGVPLAALPAMIPLSPSQVGGAGGTTTGLSAAVNSGLVSAGSGGGGINAANLAGAGGSSGRPQALSSFSLGSGGPAVVSTSGGGGAAPTFIGAPFGLPSLNGVSATNVNGASGTTSHYGVGGGGGGASLNGTNSGNGGSGGPGFALLEFFIG